MTLNGHAPPDPAPPLARSAAPVLVVEDNDDDYEIIAEGLGAVVASRQIHRAVNGDACLELLLESGRPVEPVLIVLDLQTYGTDGREVLARLRTTARYRSTPVVVLTSSRNGKDVAFCYANACNAYHVKPLDGREFRGLVRAVADYWFCRAVVPAEAAPAS